MEDKEEQPRQETNPQNPAAPALGAAEGGRKAKDAPQHRTPEEGGGAGQPGSCTEGRDPRGGHPRPHSQGRCKGRQPGPDPSRYEKHPAPTRARDTERE